MQVAEGVNRVEPSGEMVLGVSAVAPIVETGAWVTMETTVPKVNDSLDGQF